MAKKPTLPPPSAPAKPTPPKPTTAKPTPPPASAGKPNPVKPAPGKPAPAKPTPGGKPIKPVKPLSGGATSGGWATKPGAGSAAADPSAAKPVREFRGDTRKPLTPINVRPTLDELGNPVYRRIKQRIEQQPGAVESALRSSRSPDAAFRKIFGTWGRNPEMEAKAIAAAQRNGLFAKAQNRLMLDVEDDAPTQIQLQLLEFLDRSEDPVVQAALQSFYADARNGYRSVQPYEQLIEAMFGYNIELAEGLVTPEAQFRQLERLADSNLLIVYYLNSIGITQLGVSGRDAFQEFFASTPDGRPITVYLGADERIYAETQDPNYQYMGYVPLRASTRGETAEALRASMFLGSNISTATITHEFFHQLDRHLGVDNVDLSATLPVDTPNRMSLSTYLHTLAISPRFGVVGLAFNTSQIPQNARASTDITPAEYFADYGMTAVLERYASSRDDYARDLQNSEPAGFLRENGRLTPNIAATECALEQYFRQVLSGVLSDQMTFDPDLCYMSDPFNPEEQ